LAGDRVVGQDVRLLHEFVTLHSQPPFLRGRTCTTTEDMQRGVPDEY
jgi:hypothetical protein